ncbi:MAG TPA: cyclic nucleotide-binding domain-containing protein [Pyrinomonadaceae bacterium]|nr:cyclic nucleotide-binding domain-containing protein [Pyrinomonadaceae bacterium]
MIERPDRKFNPRHKAADRAVPVRPLIFHLDEASGSRLLSYGKPMLAAAGERLMGADEVPRRALFLLTGRASLHPLDTSASDVFGRSELIGFAETISRRPMCYSVVAESDCRIEMIDRKKLLLAIGRDEHLRRGLILALSTEIQEIYRLFAFL